MTSAVSSKIQRLLKKTVDIDKDERFMAVSDICTELSLLEESVASLAARSNAAPDYQITGRDLGLDSATQTAIGRALLGLLEDPSSDVQTVSVKCLALLCRRMSSEQLLTIVDKLATLVCDSAKNESRDIYAIGIKTMCGSVAVGNGAGGVGGAATGGAAAPPLMSSPSSTGVNMATRILLGMLSGLEATSKQQQDANVVDVVTTVLDIIKEVLNKFGPHLPEVHQQLLQQITPRLESPHDSIRKRSISTLAALVPYLSDPSFQQFMDTIVGQLTRHEQAASAASAASAATPPGGIVGGGGAQQKSENVLLYTYIQMIGVVSTTAGSRIGRYLPQIVPQLEKFLHLGSSGSTTGGNGADVLLELSECSLSAFESLIQSCPQEFAPFLPRILTQAREIMSYDPNYEYAPDEDEAEGGQMEDTNAAAEESKGKPARAEGAEEEEEDWGGAGEDGWGGDDEEGGAGGGGGGAAMDDVDDDEDDGDDSNTWKVRRAAVKVISAFIRSNSVLQPATIAAAAAVASASAPGTAVASAAEPVDLLRLNYSTLCDALLARFKERDQNVKVVVLQAVEDLLRESAVKGVHADYFQHALSPSSSPSSQQVFHFHQGVYSLLETKVPVIVEACMKLLKRSGSVSSSRAVETKHHVLLILAELLRVRGQVGLGAYLPKLVPILLGQLTAPGAPHGLKLDSIALLRACVEGHDASVWFGGEAASQTQTQDMVGALIKSMADTPYIKFKSEGLLTAGSIVSLLGTFKLQQASKPSAAYANVVTKPVLEQLYELVSSLLQLNDIDQELKEAALVSLSHLFFYFGAEMQSAGGDRLRDCLQIVLQQRLFNELTRLASLRCITRIALAPAEARLDVAQYVLASSAASSSASSSRVLEELISFLKKDSQVLQMETIQTLLAVLKNMSIVAGVGKASWSQGQVSQLLQAVTPLLSDTDLNLANSVLQLLAHLFRLCPTLTVHSALPQPTQDLDAIIGRIVLFLRSPLLQQQNLLQVRSLFATIMQLHATQLAPGSTINPRASFSFLFATFVRSLMPMPASSPPLMVQAVLANITSPTYLPNAAQIVGSGLLLHVSLAEQQPVLAQLVSTIQAGSGGAVVSDEASWVQVQFALLILGEFGRHVYLAPLHPGITEALFFGCFTSPQEAVRTAASLALGNIILGNIAHYLPGLLAKMQDAATPKQTMLLLLQSLRELISHINTGEHPVGLSASASAPPAEVFRTFIPALLPLLWTHAEDPEESVRSLASEVLGGLAIIDSAAAFPAMVNLVASPKPHTRSVVITALRHALTQQQQQHASAVNAGHAHAHTPALDHGLLAAHIPAFLTLLRDPDLIVRRQAILTVNALAHARGGMELLGAEFHKTILPTLYKHLIPDPSLVRMVDLGPFKHKIDDGFPLRKAAYQTLDTLLDVAFPLLDSSVFIRELGAGLTDHDDIMIAVYQILYKLSQQHPLELSRVLDTLPQKMMDGIKEKLKAAKTATADAAAASSAAASSAAAAPAGDQSSGERAKDVLRAAMRCMYSIQAMSTVVHCPGFIELYHRVLKTAMLAKILEELKQTN